MNCIRRIISYSNLNVSLFLNPHKVNIAIKCQIFTKIKVNDYLLDRSITASEILNNLIEEDAIELENIKNNYELLYSQGAEVPMVLKDNDYLELLCLSDIEKLKYYKYLADVEVKEEWDQRKNLERLRMESEEPLFDRFVTRLFSKSYRSVVLNNLYQSIALKTQEFVFDGAFEENMTMVEIKNLARQITICYGHNKLLTEPYQLVFTNLEHKSLLYNKLCKLLLCKSQFPRCTSFSQLPLFVEERSYKDVFPNRRLIYLSPDSNNPFQMGEYDHDAVYICGAFVDKTRHLPLTLARARKDRIEHRSFPIDQFVRWTGNEKSLTLVATMQAMAIARETNGDWELALKSAIPSRSVRIRPKKTDSMLQEETSMDCV